MGEKKKKVFVSGCFDPLHPGHITFFETASKYGELYVSVGADKTIRGLKKRTPCLNQAERLYMVTNIKFVHDAFIPQGQGTLDFLEEIKELKPDVFVVNEDGNNESKRTLCQDLGIEYIVLERTPFQGFSKRSSTEMRQESKIPYRLDLAGGWLDQPYVSKHHPKEISTGPVLTISLEPTHQFNLRSGMATSTRNKAIELWGNSFLHNSQDFEESKQKARVLFCYENPPGTEEIAGSQDAIGIVIPGLNKLDYPRGSYWPEKITPCLDNKILNWLENSLCLLPLNPREGDFRVLDKTNINKNSVKKLAEAAKNCYEAILAQDLDNFGIYLRKSFEAQTEMFPLMVNQEILKKIEKFKHIAKGWKITGAGGGGYLVFVRDKHIEDSIKIKIRRTQN